MENETKAAIKEFTTSKGKFIAVEVSKETKITIDFKLNDSYYTIEKYFGISSQLTEEQWAEIVEKYDSELFANYLHLFSSNPT